MKRVAFKMQLHPGQEDEYRRRHDELWPDLRHLLKTTSISEYSIFLDESTHVLFAFMKISEPLALEDLPRHPVMIRWWNYMSDIMETNPDHSPLSAPLKEVFYLP